MDRVIRTSLIAGIVLMAIVRLAVLMPEVVWLANWRHETVQLASRVDPQSILVAESWDSGLDDWTVMLQRFDPGARVVMWPGDDQQPGVAGVDDDGSGLVDDRSELGATWSDDQCKVMAAGTHQQDSERPTLVLQHGAFVPIRQTEAAGTSLPTRAIVFGTSADGQPWSMMIESAAKSD